MRAVAALHNISQSSLSRHLANPDARDHKSFIQSLQKLKVAQEDTLVELINTMDEWGLGPESTDIRQYADAILNRGKRKGDQNKKLGANWVHNFLDRHQDRLAPRWSSPLDRKRANGLNPITKEQHFKLIQDTNERYEIMPENDYGMDESAFMLGRGRKARVIGRKQSGGKRIKQSHVHQDGNRETVTVVETICADGSTLIPTVVYRGKRFNKGWAGPEANPLEAQ